MRSRSGDLNPGWPGTKQLLYHLSYHPLTKLITFIFFLQCSNLLDEGGCEEFHEELKEEYEDIRQDHYDNVAEKVRPGK